MMFEIIEKLGEALVNVVESTSLQSSTKSVQICDLLARFTTDSISSVAFGIDGNSLQNADSIVRKFGKDILDYSALDFLKFFFLGCYPNLGRKLKMKVNKTKPTEFFFNTFKQNMEYRERNNIRRNDFLQILMELKKTSSFSISDLAAESYLFFIAGESVREKPQQIFQCSILIDSLIPNSLFFYPAGYETSSSVSLYTIYELALNPDIQVKLRDEIKTGIEQNGFKLTYDMLIGFKYLDMVVKESMRMHPPAFIMRKCTKEFKIPDTNLTIPEGTQININVFSFHHDPKYFSEPMKFDPERFSAENIGKIQPFTYFPFGDGERIVTDIGDISLI